jgi:hypothetical protein
MRYHPDLSEDVQLKGAAVQPEKRLMLAVLEDAVETLRRYQASSDKHGRRLWIEAADWVGTDEDSLHFSFVNICHALDLDPAFLRRGLGSLYRNRPPDDEPPHAALG